MIVHPGRITFPCLSFLIRLWGSSWFLCLWQPYGLLWLTSRTTAAMECWSTATSRVSSKNEILFDPLIISFQKQWNILQFVFDRYMVFISALCAGYALVAAACSWVRYLVSKAWIFFISDQVWYLCLTLNFTHKGNKETSLISWVSPNSLPISFFSLRCHLIICTLFLLHNMENKFHHGFALISAVFRQRSS